MENLEVGFDLKSRWTDGDKSMAQCWLSLIWRGEDGVAVSSIIVSVDVEARDVDQLQAIERRALDAALALLSRAPSLLVTDLEKSLKASRSSHHAAAESE